MIFMRSRAVFFRSARRSAISLRYTSAPLATGILLRQAGGPREDIRQAQSLPASSELYLRPMDKLIQTAGSSALPVLIQGAVGTHKGVVAVAFTPKAPRRGPR